jgi:hypothetical protein
MINISIISWNYPNDQYFEHRESNALMIYTRGTPIVANLVSEPTFSVSRILLPNRTATSTPQAAPKVFCHADLGSPRGKVWSVDCDGEVLGTG